MKIHANLISTVTANDVASFDGTIPSA